MHGSSRVQNKTRITLHTFSEFSSYLTLPANLGTSEFLSVFDSGIAVNLLPLWRESFVLGHLRKPK